LRRSNDDILFGVFFYILELREGGAGEWGKIMWLAMVFLIKMRMGLWRGISY
jgi:hypothetical protein